jgi:hypothetical protein
VTYQEPCIVSDLPFVTADDWELADKLGWALLKPTIEPDFRNVPSLCRV